MKTLLEAMHNLKEAKPAAPEAGSADTDSYQS